MSVNDARRFYSVGPPYILHRDDALRLSVHWADYMFGYAVTPDTHADDDFPSPQAYVLRSMHLQAWGQ